MKKGPKQLFRGTFLGMKPTQLYGDYVINHYKDPGFHGKYPAGFFSWRKHGFIHMFLFVMFYGYLDVPGSY